MLYRTALLEFAAMLKVGTAAMQGLTDQEASFPETKQVTELLRQVNDIANQIATLGNGPEDDAA